MLSFGKRTDEHVTELLSAYMDNQLNARERAQADAHLRTCSVCAADLSSLQATVKAVQALPVLAAPRSFALQPTIQTSRATSLSLAFLRLATAATTVALVVSMAGQVFLRSSQMALPAAPTAVNVTADTSVSSKTAREALPTNAPAPVAIAAAPVAPPSQAAGAGSVVTPTERSLMAAPKSDGTPAPAAAPLAAAPTAAASVAAQAAAAPTATPEPAVVPTATPAPAVAQAAEPMPTAAVASQAANAVPVSPAPQTQATAPIVGALQIALAALLVVLVAALLVAGRRRR